MKAGTLKHRDRDKLLNLVIGAIKDNNDPESDFILLSVQTFYDPFDETWCAVISYYE